MRKRQLPRLSPGLLSPGLFAAGLSGSAALSLGGCSGPMSPSVPLFGAYFPSWLICTAAGVIGAVLVRVLFIRIGLDAQLPLRLLLYT